MILMYVHLVTTVLLRDVRFMSIFAYFLFLFFKFFLLIYFLICYNVTGV